MGEEVREWGRGGWGGEDLLDFLGAGELREDCWAFYSSGAFDVCAGKPVLCGGVVCGAVSGAEVDDGDFDWWGVRGGIVEKRAGGRVESCECEDACQGQAVYGDSMVVE